MAQSNELARVLQSNFRADFWECYSKLLQLGGGRRRGQLMSEALRAIDPEMFQLVIDLDIDPFYMDGRIPEFRKELGL